MLLINFLKIGLGRNKYPAIHNSSYQKHFLNVEYGIPSLEIQVSPLKTSD